MKQKHTKYTDKHKWHHDTPAWL